MFFHIFHAIKIIILFLNDVGGFFYIDSYFSFKNPQFIHVIDYRYYKNNYIN